VVELVSVKYQTLTIRGVDMVDGTPVLDIKPYLPALFPRENVRLGWYEGHIEEMLNSFAGEK
jgi:tRNA (Thr-GGU) A37 N-methylase